MPISKKDETQLNAILSEIQTAIKDNKTWDLYEEYEDDNYHAECVMLYAHTVGSDKDKKDIIEAWKQQQIDGHLTDSVEQKRREISKRLWTKFVENAKQKEGIEERFDVGGGVEGWGTQENFDELYEMFPDNHEGTIAKWESLSQEQKDAFIHNLHVTDAASEHIAESWLEFVEAESYDDWLENCTNWDEYDEDGEKNEDEEYATGGGVHKRVSVTKGYRMPHGYEAVKGSDKKQTYSKGHPKVRVDEGYRMPKGYEVVDGAYNQKYAKGSTIRANKSTSLYYANFADNWHINLLRLNAYRNQDGLPYKGGNKYAVSRVSPKGGQEVFEFKTLAEAEARFSELVAKSKTYAPIISEGRLNEYAKGSNIESDSYSKEELYPTEEIVMDWDEKECKSFLFAHWGLRGVDGKGISAPSLSRTLGHFRLEVLNQIEYAKKHNIPCEYAKGGGVEKQIETHYISYLDKDNGFKQTDKYFEGDDSYEVAVKWGRENLPNFNSDMVRMQHNQDFSFKSQFPETLETKLFNYDNPIAEKEMGGITYRIAEGLIKDGKKTYLLYKDKDLVGTFSSVDDAKKAVYGEGATIQGEGKNIYKAFYKGKEIDLRAESAYDAQKKAAVIFKAKKSYDVNVVVLQVDGKDITHSTSSFAKGATIEEEDENIAKVVYNDYYKTHQVFIDGSLYGEFKTAEEAQEYIHNGGYKQKEDCGCGSKSHDASDWTSVLDEEEKALACSVFNKVIKAGPWVEPSNLKYGNKDSLIKALSESLEMFSEIGKKTATSMLSKLK